MIYQGAGVLPQHSPLSDNTNLRVQRKKDGREAKGDSGRGGALAGCALGATKLFKNKIKHKPLNTLTLLEEPPPVRSRQMSWILLS